MKIFNENTDLFFRYLDLVRQYLVVAILRVFSRRSSKIFPLILFFLLCVCVCVCFVWKKICSQNNNIAKISK